MNSSNKIFNSSAKISLYWKCQLLGWSTVSIYWAYTVYTRDNYGVFNTLLNYVLDITIGIFLTHYYRLFALKNKWNDLSIKNLLYRVIPSIIFLALIYVLLNNIKWYLYWTTIAGEERDLWKALIYWDPILLTGLRLMSIWILAYHLYHYYQREVATTKENAKLSILTKQIQLDNLSAQLNPHFLFNSLNSIKSLVKENPNKARRAIDLLSDLLRLSLYEKSEGLISIKKELALVNDYIELEKLRFEERLSVKITLDKNLEKIKIPTLSIQLLIENAIKHGIDKIIKGGMVSLEIAQLDNTLIIKVLNPGKLTVNKSKGVGLKNLKERLALQYKTEAFFHLKEIANNTVEAQIILPLDSNEDI
ncbi:sensor histidine kinase [Tenacibaculum aiptasiae]|uniref:sensor histidine kinase n=1 Tax=Tenacibaculum aiptasiae TaxID=426481 RepID=UPI00232E7F32|nr:histidine kinase [Tenacibaculum aiptasiae]